ncbi:BLUF domain-containing protein [Qipengyuania sediminis]|uniref:BLUF domain-containing protein n=1 Tax=Qipengyuania sediminis TaxID=1532023 RepID=UPI00105A1758
MHLIAYASTSKTLLSENSLELLLDKSRINTEQHGITGMLLYKKGSHRALTARKCFFQGSV